MSRRKRRRGAGRELLHGFNGEGNSRVGSRFSDAPTEEGNSKQSRRLCSGGREAGRTELTSAEKERRRGEKRRWPEWRQATQQAAALLVGQPRTSGDREAAVADGGDFRPERRERVGLGFVMDLGIL